MQYCNNCDYIANSSANYKSHLKTQKHIKIMKFVEKSKNDETHHNTVLNDYDYFFKLSMKKTKQLEKERKNKYEKELREYFENEIRNEIENELRYKIEKELRYKIEKEIRYKLEKEYQTKHERFLFCSYKKGLAYEKYVFDTIKTNYKNCYLWNEIPINTLSDKFYKNGKICDDIGCDIIGINHDNTIDYIQCKNYNEKNKIFINSLSGFYNFVCENSINNGIVYYSGQLSNQVICRKNNIKYINLRFDKLSMNKYLVIDFEDEEDEEDNEDNNKSNSQHEIYNDKILKNKEYLECKLCNFTTNSKDIFDIHLKSKKHNKYLEYDISEDEELEDDLDSNIDKIDEIEDDKSIVKYKKVAPKPVFECKTCKFTTNSKYAFDIHLETKKHKKLNIL
jgi:hypothetical protein